VTGDFFAAVPEADLYLLKMVLHDWDDEQCVRILRNCRTAVRPTAAGSANEAERVRTIRRLRDELRRIHRRDYFPPTERDTARQAVEALAEPRTKADARR
jgi:hypothetical protein